MQKFQHKEGRKNKKKQLYKPLVSILLEKPYRMVKFWAFYKLPCNISSTPTHLISIFFFSPCCKLCYFVVKAKKYDRSNSWKIVQWQNVKEKQTILSNFSSFFFPLQCFHRRWGGKTNYFKWFFIFFFFTTMLPQKVGHHCDTLQWCDIHIVSLHIVHCPRYPP